MLIADPDSIIDPNQHRAYRVPGFLSSRPNWLPPPLHPQAGVAPPPGSRGGDTLDCGRGGVGEPIRMKGQTLWYSTLSSNFINRSLQNYKSSSTVPVIDDNNWVLKHYDCIFLK